MQILEHLEGRAPADRGFQRIVLLGPDAGPSHVSAVLVRIPPDQEFALHTHPRSEDCFFVLSGAGEVMEPGRTLSVAAPAGVWIPAGHPHGLRAGPEGMLEIGFQSPADPAAVAYDPPDEARPVAHRLQTVSLHRDPACGAGAGWRQVFPDRPSWRYLDPHCSLLHRSQRIALAADGCEIVAVVGRGAVEHAGGRIAAMAALHLRPGEETALVGLEAETLLLAIRAVAATG
jgi:quercetin dioxygenase-like cupin family protein